MEAMKLESQIKFFSQCIFQKTNKQQQNKSNGIYKQGIVNNGK